MNAKYGLFGLVLLSVVACNTDTQDDEPWWEDDQYNTDDTDDGTADTDEKDDDDKGDDDKGDDDKGDGNSDVPDCPDGFDPTETCTGDPKSSACMFEGDLYYCLDGKWVIYETGK